MLALDDVRLAYGGIQALRGVSLQVEEGEIVALLGANGAGKTSTLQAISGTVPLQGGRVEFEGTPLSGLPSHEIVRRGIVQVPEGRQVFSELTVEENLLAGSYSRRDRAAVRADLDGLYRRFPRLGERRAQLAGTLSGGEQQMLAIARALVARPRLLLLDEPSMGLAPKLVREIFAIIAELNRDGATILLVEQNAHMALQVACRAYVLETGRVVLSGSAAELRDNPEVRRSYLGAREESA